MSNFLLVVPPDWTEIPEAGAFFQNYASPENISQYLAEGAIWQVQGALDNAGYLPVGMMVIDARVFDDGIPRLWVKFAPEV